MTRQGKKLPLAAWIFLGLVVGIIGGLALMTIPGIVACVVCSIFFPALATVAGLLGMSVVNGGISVLVLWLCRNLLQYAELNNR